MGADGTAGVNCAPGVSGTACFIGTACVIGAAFGRCAAGVSVADGASGFFLG